MHPSCLILASLLYASSAVAADGSLSLPDAVAPSVISATQQAARIEVFRPDDLPGNACDIGLFLQDQLTNRLAPGESISLEVPAGGIALGVARVGSVYCEETTQQPRIQSALLEPGETRRYSIMADQGGVFLSPQVE